MKKLTLLRHAKSGQDSPSGSDFDRTLNERGRADAKRMGEEIRDLGLTFDLVLASPARRVIETIEGARGLSPRFDDQIYDASTEQLLAIVRSVDKRVESLLLIGHNPGFEQLAARLTDDAIDDVPAGALIEIELPIDDWRDVDEGSGRQVRFIKPNALT